MSYQSFIHCDYDDCDTHVSMEMVKDAGFFTIFDGIYPIDAYIVKHFCSWDCIMKYAASKPPLEQM